MNLKEELRSINILKSKDFYGQTDFQQAGSTSVPHVVRLPHGTLATLDELSQLRRKGDVLWGI